MVTVAQTCSETRGPLRYTMEPQVRGLGAFFCAGKSEQPAIREMPSQRTREANWCPRIHVYRSGAGVSEQVCATVTISQLPQSTTPLRAGWFDGCSCPFDQRFRCLFKSQKRSRFRSRAFWNRWSGSFSRQVLITDRAKVMSEGVRVRAP